MDTEVIEVVSDSLPDTGHTVPCHNKEEGKDRMKGHETGNTATSPRTTDNPVLFHFNEKLQPEDIKTGT